MPSLFLQKEKVEELQSIIRQSAKERLWLERQISNGDQSRTPSPMLLSGEFAADIRKKTEKLDIIEAENKKLKSSVEQLQRAEAESAKLVGSSFKRKSITHSTDQLYLTRLNIRTKMDCSKFVFHKPVCT